MPARARADVTDTEPDPARLIAHSFSKGSAAVRQPVPIPTERRKDPRYPQAFAFWICPEEGYPRTSAWMLDMSAGGAAFLTAAAEAPPIGARIRLVEMQTHDRLVREGAVTLPAFARVLRHDGGEGLTRRVAVRFESDAQLPIDPLKRRTAAAVCPHSPSTPPLPPPGVTRMPGIIRAAEQAGSASAC